MNILELCRVALTALGVNVLRSILTMLGIVIGVGAVITMVTVAAGAQQEIDDQMESIGSTLISVWPGSRSRGGVRSSGNWHVMTESDGYALKERISDITAAAPYLRGNAQIVYGNSNWSTRIHGVNEDFLVARNWPLKEGRSFDTTELNRGEKVAIVGLTVADELFGESQVIGQTIRINNVPFSIIGILSEKGSNDWYDQDDTLLVPIKAGRTRLMGRTGSGGDAVHGMYITVDEEWMMDDVQDQIKEVLAERHRLASGDEAFSIRNMSEMIETQLEARNTFNYLLSAIASVSLVVGGIGIMNIMLVSVTERTREIGLRMAVGASSSNIMNQFLVEAIVLCFFGGLIGVIAALGVSWGISSIANWPVLIQWYVVILAVGFSGIIGVFFGFYPARKASLKNPIDALRTE